MTSAGISLTALAGCTGALVTLLVTPCAAALARRAGWLDRSEGGARSRKLQARPVPPVGGVVLFLGLAATSVALRASGGHWDATIAAWIDPRAGAATLGCACLAGALDDFLRGGLRPLHKLLLQALAALPAALSLFLHRLPAGAPEAALSAIALVVAAVVAQNAFNTFDNADGATTSLSILALAFHAPVFAGPLLGFLPWNLNARRSEGARATPTAYLGDAGSHMLGILLLLVPAAWPVFALPLFDLLRVSMRRLSVGSRPWVGDRRHLAHRLAHAGHCPRSVCALLLAVALPCLARPGLVGLGLTCLFFGLAVALTREPEQPTAAA